jgi:hypothetical protein
VRNKPVKTTPKNPVTDMIEHSARWIWGSESFYRDIYDGARLEAGKIHDREKVAAHWLRQHKWFSRQLALNTQTEDKLDVLIEIVAACKKEYELHA